MLLRFRAENHRSFRDSAELSLVAAHAKGAVPADRNWLAATTRVAGVYGANASGKSTLLDAIEFMRDAVHYSATRWGDREGFPYQPFLLDEESSSKPSSYEIDFVQRDTRYNYGFVSAADGIHEEWLYSYHTNRRTMLFERTGVRAAKFSFGRTLAGENVTISRLVRPTSLYLSTAANSNHPILAGVQGYISRHIDYARYSDQDKSSRLHWIRTLLEDKGLLEIANSLIGFADLGIANVELAEESIDDESLAYLRRLVSALTDGGGSGAQALDEIVDNVKKKVRFRHHREGQKLVSLPLAAESGGTIAWLALGVPATLAILQGHLFMVDEIDSSLHPRLTAALIHLFKDPEINRRGGQLVFTSHDATVLGSLAGETLARDEVWFTEKRQDGGSELYSLNEFPVRDSDNFERRYLHGRYGAVPILQFDGLRKSLLAALEGK